MKDCRCQTSSENLKLTQLDWNLLLKCIVPHNETLKHSYDNEFKQQSMQWKHACSPSPQKFKMQASAGKIMCIIFCDVGGVLLVDFMLNKVTVRQLYYTDLLHKLHVAIKDKHKGKLTQVPLPAWKCICSQDKLLYLNPNFKK